MFQPPSQGPFIPPQQSGPPFLPTRVPLGNQAMPSSGLQGIIQRLLPSASSNIASGSGGSNIMGALNNVQQVLRVAQSATPLIKEYGPMIKNAPKLMSMMKALNEMDDDEEQDEDEDNVNDGKETDVDILDEELDDIDDLETTEFDEGESSTVSKNSGASQPKLFI
ncbi:VrrA/YqfQ family protein [Gracilibacillus sp. YIM 98692]|uniref:VrrA/YqfQ family protein n=1 Tax=Gracilibacillus sp. YIM 98692 TaxID=2663532 RepID=UPI0013D10CBE|nr:VrrA/YqfQ family protein [Gracilibacillus sp. YIM 98692]